MSTSYRGFWNPNSTYASGDIVEYYSEDGYAQPAVAYLRKDTAESKSCPLLNFTRPTIQGDVVMEVELSQTTLRGRVAVGWEEYEYYDSTGWTGPNGSSLEIDSTEWEEFLTTNSNWSQPGSYDTSFQTYNSDSQDTLFVGKYDETSTDLNINFDEVQGETDSDSYYLSSVQNYSGYFDEANSYKQFDIVRSEHSNAFYYARADISGANSSVSSVTVNNCRLRLPTDYVSGSTQVATLEYFGSTPSGWDNDFLVGQLLSLENFSTKNSSRKLLVLGVSDSLIFLGSYSEGQRDLITPEEITTDTDIPVLVSKINSTEDSDLWANNEFFFDADYGSRVSFRAINKKFDHGDGYQSVSPFGVNSLRMTFDLEFSNRSNREANAMLHFVENKLGQHQSNETSQILAYDLGISGFKMGGESLFFPYLSPENLTRKFYCLDFSHEIENEDINTVNLKITNTDASTLNVAEQIFVKSAPVWSSDYDYAMHDVVFYHENQKYYYSCRDDNNANRPAVEKEGSIVSINRNMWTREFFWKPSVSFNVNHKPKVKSYETKDGTYVQYRPEHQQNINPLEFDIKFENRNDQEAYAILHFLETHLGYLSFLFVPPAPYNRKRRFYCEEWTHTYVFKNNHTVSANFKQFPLGQNTPLDDDEIDDTSTPVPIKSGKLVASTGKTSVVRHEIGDGYLLRMAIKLTNPGETEITLIPDNSDHGQFKYVGWGHDSSVASSLNLVPDTELTPSALTLPMDGYSITNSEAGVVYANAQTVYSHTNIGALYETGSSSGSAFKGFYSHPNIYEPPFDNKILPGQVFHLYYSLDSKSLVDSAKRGDSLTQDIPLTYRDSDNVEFSSTSSLGVLINPELYDINKQEVSVEISSTFLSSFEQKSFDVHPYSQGVSRIKQSKKDSYFDIACDASLDEQNLAVPLSTQDFNEIDRINSSVEGFLFLGVRYDHAEEKYFNFYNKSEVDTSLWVGITIENPSEDGYVAYDPLSKKIKTFTSNSTEVAGSIREFKSYATAKSVNISSEISKKPEMADMNIEEIAELNITLTGVFLGENSFAPAVRTGTGYSSSSVVNIYLGTEDQPCYIIGRGGKGGSGMVSEGVIFQDGEAVERIYSVSMPENGKNGGTAFLSEHPNVNIFIINGFIYSGGGGGGGGGFQGNAQRPRTSNNVNFGGGGSGGFGGAKGGFPFGGGDCLLASTLFRSPGEPVNNSSDTHTHLTSGGSGGFFGQSGKEGGQQGYIRVDRGESEISPLVITSEDYVSLTGAEKQEYELLDFIYNRVGKGGFPGNCIEYYVSPPVIKYLSSSGYVPLVYSDGYNYFWKKETGSGVTVLNETEYSLLSDKAGFSPFNLLLGPCGQT